MHSDQEMFRGTVRVRNLDDEPHTMIAPRPGFGGKARVWLTVDSAWKTTVSMVDSEVSQLCELLTTAQRVRASRAR